MQTVCLNVVVGCKLDLIDTNKQPREVDEQLGRGLAEVLHKNQLEKVLLYYMNFMQLLYELKLLYIIVIPRMKKTSALYESTWIIGVWYIIEFVWYGSTLSL